MLRTDLNPAAFLFAGGTARDDDDAAARLQAGTIERAFVLVLKRGALPPRSAGGTERVRAEASIVFRWEKKNSPPSLFFLEEEDEEERAVPGFSLLSLSFPSLDLMKKRCLCYGEREKVKQRGREGEGRQRQAVTERERRCRGRGRRLLVQREKKTIDRRKTLLRTQKKALCVISSPLFSAR